MSEECLLITQQLNRIKISLLPVARCPASG